MEAGLTVGWSMDITVGLVNAVDVRTPTDLREFLVAHGELEPVVNGDDLAAILQLRTRLRTVFEAAVVDDAAQVVNDLLDAHATRPYLSNHDGTPWHLHVSHTEASWAAWLTARTALALALVIADGGFHRLRRCEARDCAMVLFDTSRNRTRRFCSTTCATRTRVAAHRRRSSPR